VGHVYPYHLNNVELLLKKSQVDEDMLEQGFLGNWEIERKLGHRVKGPQVCRYWGPIVLRGEDSQLWRSGMEPFQDRPWDCMHEERDPRRIFRDIHISRAWFIGYGALEASRRPLQTIKMSDWWRNRDVTGCRDLLRREKSRRSKTKTRLE